MNRTEARKLDTKDKLRKYRRLFHLPKGVIYLDGNSLGAMPKAAVARVADCVKREWGEDLIRSWNKNGWWDLSHKAGDKVAKLIGGGVGNVVVADSISVNLFKALTAAVQKLPERKIILSDSGNFHNDLYVAQGLNALMNKGYRLKIVEPNKVAAEINESVAVVLLTDIDYRSARRHNMAALTKLAHEKGALTVWDLAHSAGAVPVDLLGCDADFAIGCTYKYLNGGPGAPGFIFVHPRLQNAVMPGLVGWWGHQRPFAFDMTWEAADGITRFQSGTQPILSLVALDTALDVWRGVNIDAVYEKSQKLCCWFWEEVEVRLAGHGFSLLGSDDFGSRGSHVCIAHDESYAIMQCLISKGVIGDFRAPNLMRFGFAPLYSTYDEMIRAVEILVTIMDKKLWDRPRFKAKKAVT